MFCRKCGSQMEEGAKFCKACGTAVEENHADASQTTGTGNGGMNMSGQNASGGSAPFQNGMNGSFVNNLQPGAIKNFSPMDIVVLIGAVAMIIASFLPFVSISFFGSTASRSLFDGGDGWFFMGVAVIVIVLTFLKLWVPQLVFAAIGFMLMIYECIDASDALDSAGIGDKGLGYYLLVISALAMLGGAIAKKVIKK